MKIGGMKEGEHLFWIGTTSPPVILSRRNIIGPINSIKKTPAGNYSRLRRSIMLRSLRGEGPMNIAEKRDQVVETVEYKPGIFVAQLSEVAPAIATLLETYASRVRVHVSTGDALDSYGVSIVFQVFIDVLTHRCKGCGETQFTPPNFGDCPNHRFTKEWIEIASGEAREGTRDALLRANHHVTEWIAARSDQTRLNGWIARRRIPQPPLDRFMASIRKVEVGEDECWIFDADTFRVSDDLITTPARFIYEQVAGEKLVETAKLLRTCKTPQCCRPSHREVLLAQAAETASE
jgi:hypothetical protein